MQAMEYRSAEISAKKERKVSLALGFTLPQHKGILLNVKQAARMHSEPTPSMEGRSLS